MLQRLGITRRELTQHTADTQVRGKAEYDRRIEYPVRGAQQEKTRHRTHRDLAGTTKPVPDPKTKS